MNLNDLAELTGKSIDEIKAEFENQDCISINLNGR